MVGCVVVVDVPIIVSVKFGMRRLTFVRTGAVAIVGV